MHHFTSLNIILLFCGLLIHFLYAIEKQKKLNRGFSIGFYLKDNWITMLTTIVCAISSLLMVDDIANLLHIKAEDGSPFYNVHAFISGIVPMFFLNKLMKILKAAG